MLAAGHDMRALIFSIDILPYQDRVQTSGGSLRSEQFIEQFEAAGFDVVKAVPSQSLLVRTQRHLLADADFVFFDVSNQAEIVAEVQPDVIVWGWPLIAQIPIKPLIGVVSLVDLNGFQNIESATASGGDIQATTRAVLQRARQADVVVYGSSEQRAYWEGLFRLNFGSDPLPRGFTLPYHKPARLPRPYADRPTDFYYVGSFLPWLSPFRALFTLADELRHTHSRLVIFASTQPVSLGDDTRSDLIRLTSHERVVLEAPLPHTQLYQRIGFSGVAFDMLEESFERRFAYPIRTASFLGHGIPLLFNDFSCISREVEISGAGWTTPQDDKALRSTIQAILRESHEALAMRSAAATKLAERLFSFPEAWARMFDHLQALTKPKARSRRAPPTSGKRNVMVISDDEPNILNLRCVEPLEALMRRDLIGGYTVVGNEGVRRSTLGSGDADVHSIIVQRVPQVPSVAILELTKGRFTYDIDDNLLVSPIYRPPFPPDFNWKVRTLLAEASAVTVTNAFLARSLAIASGIDFAGRARVLPNPLLRRRRAVEHQPIERVFFASSDELPLTASAERVFPAIGAFCRRRGLEFWYMGNYPKNPVFARYLSGVQVKPLAFKRYHEYLDMIEDLGALAVVPLETHGDAATVEFAKAKSDIKVVEYLGLGLPAVFSDAAPYRYTDLPIPSLAPNDEDCWGAALEAAFTRSAADRADVAAEIEKRRWIGGSISDLWLETLEQNALRHPLRVQHAVDSLASTITKLRFSAWPAENFDAMFYLEQNRDVQIGIETGMIDDAYGHYLRHGRLEGRKASSHDTGRSLVQHIEESKAAIIGLDGELNRTDHRIHKIRQQFGVAS